MKANELRIGNLTEQGKIKTFWEKGVHVGFGKCYEFNEIKPIPLTEEWLLKFGFEKYEGLFYKKTLGGFIQNECNGWIYEVGDNQICFFNHVHQLQNLYFALTQEELKIK